jgi:hypothetical protein
VVVRVDHQISPYVFVQVDGMFHHSVVLCSICLGWSFIGISNNFCLCIFLDNVFFWVDIL